MLLWISKHKAGVTAGGNGQNRAILCQHRVQRDHRIAVGPGQFAKIRLIGELGETRHWCGKFAAKLAPAEHQAWRS